ncbi:MAG: hypothetical protein MAG795_00359 [Candidatus Woesearchaeota archaeon]|nr:hypothetical protein [Candidatus Woesearchaeota archaeon]
MVGKKTYNLEHEMAETPAIVRNIDIDYILGFSKFLTGRDILLTGEGSSRIFPANKTRYDSLKHGYKPDIRVEGATQSLEYSLDFYDVFVASNSGQTKECIRLIRWLKQKAVGLTATPGSIMSEDLDEKTYILSCGKEYACAATKSVVEQALFYDILFRSLNNQELPDLAKLGDLIENVLTSKVNDQIVESFSNSQMIYWAGKNNGVAEELTLKTMEIIRKNAIYLEGTYAVHGIEEVMEPEEAVIWVDPFPSETHKFKEVLVDGVQMQVIAISDTQTQFPTLIVPDYDDFNPYLQLVAGWNLLVKAGLRLGVNMDKTQRARKIGNKYI